MKLIEQPDSIETIEPDSLLLGDCLELMKKLPDHSVDAIICDLPYSTTQCAWDVLLPFDRLWDAYHRIIRPHGNVVLFGAQPFTTKIILSNPNEFRYCLYWLKEKGTGFLNAARQPLRIIEEICVFHCGKVGVRYNPQMVPLDQPRRRSLPRRKTHAVKSVASYESPDNTVVDYTHQYPTTLIECARDGGNRGLIATQKPVALLEYLVRTYSDVGDTVLDATMGSGTTGVACAALRRQFIGMELNAGHFTIAARRITEAMCPAWLETA